MSKAEATPSGLRRIMFRSARTRCRLATVCGAETATSAVAVDIDFPVIAPPEDGRPAGCLAALLIANTRIQPGIGQIHE